MLGGIHKRVCACVSAKHTWWGIHAQQQHLRGHVLRRHAELGKGMAPQSHPVLNLRYILAMTFHVWLPQRVVGCCRGALSRLPQGLGVGAMNVCRACSIASATDAAAGRRGNGKRWRLAPIVTRCKLRGMARRQQIGVAGRECDDDVLPRAAFVR